MKKHIPNLITLLNIAAGTLAVFFVLGGNVTWALILFSIAAVLDFADGMAARLLNAGSEIGKQLDSLADLVSFGLLSTAMIYSIFQLILLPEGQEDFGDLSIIYKLMMFSVIIVPMLAALRLAIFNLQKNTDYFQGLSVPAFALFWCGIYYDLQINNSFFGRSMDPYFLTAVLLISALLMVVPVPMLSLKFRNFKLRDNFGRYLVLLLSVIILIFTGLAGLPLVVLMYILISLSRILLT